MTLPSHRYGNPADLVKFEAEKNHCRGCRKELSTTITGKLVKYCDIGKKHGQGCGQYLR